MRDHVDEEDKLGERIVMSGQDFYSIPFMLSNITQLLS